MNLIDLIEKDGIGLKRMAGTGGGEYAGPCPWCGGKDRFRVWPESGRYWCRACQRKGDSIQYLRDNHGTDFADACLALGRESKKGRIGAGKKGKTKRREWKPGLSRQPTASWVEQAGRFLQWTQENLWADSGHGAVEYLLKRGFTRKTIKSAGLGWNPKPAFLERESWGLSKEASDKTGKPKKLWLPGGLVIPCLAGGKLIRLRIRQREGASGPRYVAVPGGDFRPMVLGDVNTGLWVVVESELDAILLGQEAGELAGVVGLGSAAKKPDMDCHNLLLGATRILVALDADKAGAESAWGFWLNTYPQAKRWSCIGGKDPGEAFENGLNLNAWVRAGLPDQDKGAEKQAEPAENTRHKVKTIEITNPRDCPGPYDWKDAEPKKWTVEYDFGTVGAYPLHVVIVEGPYTRTVSRKWGACIEGDAGSKKNRKPAPGDCKHCPACATWPGHGAESFCFHAPYFLGQSKPDYLTCENARRACPLAGFVGAVGTA